MALKADRFLDATDISFFMNATGAPGYVCVHTSTGSGAAMDNASSLVAIPTGQAPSGTKPAGILVTNVVNYDLTKQHLNQHRDEVQIGSKVTLLRRGFVVSNIVTGSPVAGDRAYYTSAGIVTPTDPGSGIQIGRFLTKQDADGYAKIEVNIT